MTDDARQRPNARTIRVTLAVSEPGWGYRVEIEMVAIVRETPD